MQALRAGPNTGRLLPAALAVLAAWAVLAPADEPPNPTKGGPPTKAEPTKAEAPKPPQKTVQFEMRDKPWSSVLEWLADQTGLAVVSVYKPVGTFTYIAPKTKKSLTIAEVIDI